ncbi:SNF1-interacting protein, partial [Mortierella polycephala]
MGNTSTKEKTDSVDGGALLPHGIYTGPQDYDFRIVQRLILQRKLAPFYKGLEDWDDSEDAQEEKKNQQRIATNSNSNSSNSNNKSSSHSRTHSQSNHNSARGGNSSNSNYNNYSNADRHLTDSEREKKRLYQGAIECPICFL